MIHGVSLFQALFSGQYGLEISRTYACQPNAHERPVVQRAFGALVQVDRIGRGRTTPVFSEADGVDSDTTFGRRTLGNATTLRAPKYARCSMSERAARRPMPAEQSIHWKPLHDPHYILASLQPGGGGRQQIFVRQEALARVQTLVASSERKRLFGLLIGQFYFCPITGIAYFVIESPVEQSPVTDDAEVAARIAAELERHADPRARVLGWYDSVASVDSRPSAGTAHIHTSSFSEPWQTALVIGQGSNSGGAFFLHDAANTRWFCAPFYELLDDAPAMNQSKPTCIQWPAYMTVDQVVHMGPDLATTTSTATVESETSRDAPHLAPSEIRDHGTQPPLTHHMTDTSEDVSESGAQQGAIAARSSELDAPGGPIRSTSDSRSPGSTPRLADTSDVRRETFSARLSDRPADALGIVDDPGARTSVPRATRQIADNEDAVAGDGAMRFLQIAQAEGFVIAARFDAVAEAKRRESLWILSESPSGLLLVVAAAADEVIDASLHYNVRTDDDGLLRTPFPEHRDRDSKTVYVRDACVEPLRKRCRQLRATDTLVREWKASPGLSFLMPGEWRFIAASTPIAGARGLTMVNDLNDSRIAELPESVRRQFKLTKAADAHW